MKRRPRLAAFLLLFLFTSRGWALWNGKLDDGEQTADLFKTTVRLALSQSLNGIDGFLELRQDARITPRISGLLWGTGDVDFDDDPELASFKKEPPRNATIQVADQRGKILESKRLERPLAKLLAVKLYGDWRRTYLLTVDYSAGFGSYSGPITRLAEITGGRLRWIDATDPKTGRSGEISLMESLKTTWKFVNGPNGRGKQILLAQCRPDWSSVKDDPDFTTTYARFYFDGSRWRVKERTVKGITEFDQGFPRPKSFP